MGLKVKIASGWKEKLFGLVGEDKAYPLLVQTRFGIHTFGLRFPIDVLVLGRHNRVTEIKENLLPNKIFIWNPKYTKVLELPAGKIKRIKLKVGSKVKITA